MPPSTISQSPPLIPKMTTRISISITAIALYLTISVLLQLLLALLRCPGRPNPHRPIPTLRSVLLQLLRCPGRPIPLRPIPTLRSLLMTLLSFTILVGINLFHWFLQRSKTHEVDGEIQIDWDTEMKWESRKTRLEEIERSDGFGREKN
ncbi:hypothetical protein RchiOBHm_Chr7g0195851 [Rosa chinensis]|uniref:Uncharacterized protein n=1 Tax=Rosa chinensis TaxID=74649 RepID=A0A2P6P6F5_ROSCH|nr:hypothetical protein RchiOBHm_Chr7g0195851 [Rosa chinensis]